MLLWSVFSTELLALSFHLYCLPREFTSVIWATAYHCTFSCCRQMSCDAISSDTTLSPTPFIQRQGKLENCENVFIWRWRSHAMMFSGCRLDYSVPATWREPRQGVWLTVWTTPSPPEQCDGSLITNPGSPVSVKQEQKPPGMKTMLRKTEMFILQVCFHWES